MRRRGCIDQIANGRFRARLSIHGKPETVGFYDTREAAQKAIEVASDVAQETAHDFEGVTLEDFGRKLLTRRMLKHEVKDPQNDWSRWNTHVKPDVVAKLAVKRIRPDHLHRWLQRVGAKVGSVLTVRACKTLVSVVLAEAVTENIIKANPMREIKVKGRAVEAWTFLHPDEQTRLLAALSLEARCLVGFAIGTGLRAGELVTLRLGDLHAYGDRPCVVVRYGKPPAEPTKTGKVRTVPLFGLGLSAARAWLESHPIGARRARVPACLAVASGRPSTWCSGRSGRRPLRTRASDAGFAGTTCGTRAPRRWCLVGGGADGRFRR